MNACFRIKSLSLTLLALPLALSTGCVVSSTGTDGGGGEGGDSAMGGGDAGGGGEAPSGSMTCLSLIHI